MNRAFGCWNLPPHQPHTHLNDLLLQGWRFVKCYHRFGTADMFEKDGEFCFLLCDRAGIFSMPDMKALIKAEWRPSTDEDQAWLDSL